MYFVNTKTHLLVVYSIQFYRYTAVPWPKPYNFAWLECELSLDGETQILFACKLEIFFGPNEWPPAVPKLHLNEMENNNHFTSSKHHPSVQSK